MNFNKFIKMMKLISIICFSYFLVACQPTPEVETVIQKDNFESLVENSASMEVSDSELASNTNIEGSHIQWNYENEIVKETVIGDITLNTEIKVDALVDLSDKKAAVFLVKPTKFSSDFIQKAVTYFYGNTYYSGIRTKDDYLLKILPMEEFLPKIDISDYQVAESLLKRWKKSYNDAAETNKAVNVIGDYQSLFLKGYPYQGAIGEFYLYNGDMSNTYFYYYVDDVNKSYCETPFEYTGIPAIGMTTPQEEAKEIAFNAVREIYGNDTQLVYTTLANMSKLDQNWLAPFSMALGKDGYGNRDQCYVYYFTRTYNGIPQLYAPEASNHNRSDSEQGGYLYEQKWDYAYSMKWPAEYIMVAVDDTGIIEFWGYSPTEIASVINDNVEMLSFEDIFEQFKKTINYTSVWTTSITEQLDIEITDINFGMVRTPRKDNPKEYYMVPAWQFSGSKYTYTSKVAGGMTEEETGKTFLVLNAIDGSIIDTSYYENERPGIIKMVGQH
ncbi:MAG: hypothetical protein JXN65_08415 [Clostridia bacterium]|nr:hypothetical protein [Clostridia bacterium]